MIVRSRNFHLFDFSPRSAPFTTPNARIAPENHTWRSRRRRRKFRAPRHLRDEGHGEVGRGGTIGSSSDEPEHGTFRPKNQSTMFRVRPVVRGEGQGLGRAEPRNSPRSHLGPLFAHPYCGELRLQLLRRLSPPAPTGPSKSHQVIASPTSCVDF